MIDKMTTLQNQESPEDRAMRPLTFESFLGQEHAKPNLELFVKSARARGDSLDHVLLAGPPGLGKTTLSNIVANELGSRLVTIFAPTIRSKGELCAILASMKKGDVLLIDEIHNLRSDIEEILYPVMEDFKLEFVSNNIPLTINLEPFTIIGATTRAGMLQRPLRDRFGITVDMQPYTVDELSKIATSSAKKLGLTMTQWGADELARRSRGTPRIANKLLKRIRDFAVAANTKEVDAALVALTCDRLGIDDAGLDINMQKYLGVLAAKNKPLAAKTLTSLTGESMDTIEDVIEPFLMKLGFVDKTAQGRVITTAGRAHLNRDLN